MKNNLYINEDIAKQLIDFSGGKKELEPIGNEQLKGAVALYNKLMDKNVAYLADEVGMGKTYVAIGIVTLMRYFNPSLRVLYILPKQNILTKWLDTDYSNFLRNNFLVKNYKVKTHDDKPAVPQVECNNLADLIKYSSTGYYGDYFIKMSSFSFGLSEEEESLEKSLKALKELVPAYKMPEHIENKAHVKNEYAETINKILPDFDLVIIDEAHNFRKDIDTSDRNKVLSRILGTHPKSKGIKRVKKALLLSATPFDRSLKDLQNQLAIFDQKKVLETIPETKEKRNEILSNFMIRRLNVLKINGVDHTRNMYRNEKRASAAIELDETDYKQKLIVALVQKKVGELIDDLRGQFQTGMLASFESYIPSTKSIDVEFDGEQEDKGEAKDASIITLLTQSYSDTLGGRNLPHPKMDKTVEKYEKSAFVEGEKHLIFVRRVQSIHDLKEKFDDAYDQWIKQYLEDQIKDEYKKKDILATYDNFKENQGRNKGIEETEEKESDIGAEIKPSNNNFFTHFFRGKFDGEAAGYPKPLTVRRYLTDDKNNLLAKECLADGMFYKRLDELGLIIHTEDSTLNAFYKELLFSFLRLGHGFIDMYIAYLNAGSQDTFIDAFIETLKSQKGIPFSTYSQLKDLHDNYEIIIKTNFSKYRDNESGVGWRRYIQRQLSPLEPIVGAKGGDDKSAVARKFRMPGYPMILVSTDVLQEGEDLHTFCDSVIHYGLSATPIAIEQKTGRVDRIGSYAQRKLLKENADVIRDGIKVSFPFIKESVEIVQVRNIANRLNAFLDSLHEFEGNKNISEENDITAIEDTSSIPELIKSELVTPFKITSNDLNPLDKALVYLDIEQDNSYVETIKTHINRLTDGMKSVSLEPSSNPYEMLLKMESDERICKSEEESLLEYMHRVSYKNYHRTILKKMEKYEVGFDVQMLVGDQTITQASEIVELEKRLLEGKDIGLQKRDMDITSLFNASLLKTELFVRNHQVDASLSNHTITYRFNLHDKNQPARLQNVYVEQLDGYIVFTSKVKKWCLQEYEDKDLIRFTWQRNVEIDLVEFVLDEDDWLVGRVVHPSLNIQAKEFMYCSYILACETDHLKQIIDDLLLKRDE